MLVAWIGAWAVIGYSILPYLTVPARWLTARRWNSRPANS